jgi:hypothetical protein
MFPELDIEMDIDIDEEDAAETAASLGMVPLYDFNNRQYVVRDGKVVMASEDEAIQQWVAFLILTKKDRFPVYNETEFGTYIENYIGLRGSNLGFVASEFRREIEEGCQANPGIDHIEDFEMTVTNGVGQVSLTVVKTSGEQVEVRADV